MAHASRRRLGSRGGAPRSRRVPVAARVQEHAARAQYRQGASARHAAGVRDADREKPRHVHHHHGAVLRSSVRNDTSTDATGRALPDRYADVPNDVPLPTPTGNDRALLPAVSLRMSRHRRRAARGGQGCARDAHGSRAGHVPVYYMGEDGRSDGERRAHAKGRAGVGVPPRREQGHGQSVPTDAQLRVLHAQHDRPGVQQRARVRQARPRRDGEGFGRHGARQGGGEGQVRRRVRAVHQRPLEPDRCTVARS